MNSLSLNGITSANGLVLPKHIGDDLDLSNLESAEGIILPEHIGRSLYLSNLTSAEDLVLPEYVRWGLFLDNLKNAKNIVLPKHVGDGQIDLISLETLDGLIIPEDFDYEIRTKFGIINKDNIGEYRSKGKIH